nr:hypothetical protein [Tanacetum cinerariifolium]
MESLRESILERAKHKREKDRRVNDRMMKSKKRKDNSSKVLDVGLVVTKSNKTESESQWLRNTTLESTYISHRGEKIDQNADDKKCQVSCPLPDPSFDNMTIEFSNQFLEYENISLKKTVAQLQKDLSRMETPCINIELKYQNQALKDGQHGQILNETSNEANIKREINVLEARNIDLERKPVLQPPRNQSVVRQPNEFKSERPNFSKLRFASQVDVNNVLSKPVTPHYLLKVRESALAKPHYVNAPSSSRNSKKESYGSNDMAYNYYLEEAKKNTQDKS